MLGSWIKMRYERLSDLCFFCGIIGHIAKDCNLSFIINSSPSPKNNNFGPWLRFIPPPRGPIQFKNIVSPPSLAYGPSNFNPPNTSHPSPFSSSNIKNPHISTHVNSRPTPSPHSISSPLPQGPSPSSVATLPPSHPISPFSPFQF